MFGIAKKQLAGSKDLVGTIIGKETYFSGSINSQESVRLDGNFEGDIGTTNDLVVSATGHVKGHIKARNATIGGLIDGNVDVAEKLELLTTARVYGDIKTTVLSVNEGAVLRGACLTQNEDSVAEAKVNAGGFSFGAKLTEEKT